MCARETHRGSVHEAGVIPGHAGEGPAAGPGGGERPCLHLDEGSGGDTGLGDMTPASSL